MIFRHADCDKTLLTVVFSVIEPLDSEGIPEDTLRQVEGDVMCPEIAPAFGVIPLKVQQL
jgi:hypothetical protein